MEQVFISLLGGIPNLLPVRSRDQGLKPLRDVTARVPWGSHLNNEAAKP